MMSKKIYLLTWIKTNGVQKVVGDGQQSNFSTVSSDVPQETVIISLLINDS